MTPCAPQPAFLMLKFYAGLTATPILIVGMTPTRYWITPAGEKPVQLAGRQRYVQPGQRALVPNYTVSFQAPKNAEVTPNGKL